MGKLEHILELTGFIRIYDGIPSGEHTKSY